MEKLISSIRSVLNEKELNLFDSVLEMATSAEEKGGDYIFYFDIPELDLDVDEIFRIGITPDSKDYSRIYKNFPDQLIELFKVSGQWSFGETGSANQLVLDSGCNGTLHNLGSDIWKKPKVDIAYSTDICSPLDIGMKAFVFVHPVSGELFLYDEVVEKIEEGSPIERFLRELQDRVKL